MTVGEKIRRARRRSGLSQAQLGRKIGVSRYLISHVESGRRPLHERYIARLAAALHLDEKELEQ